MNYWELGLIMNFIKLYSLIVFALLINACSSGSSDSNGGGGTTTPNENGEISHEQAKKRWPGNGSYSNSFSYNGCKDTYEFGNQADYCLALTDDTKANCESSNYDSRKMAYTESCGDDFSPRNIKSPVSISGYDSYLKRRCEFKTDERFPTVKHLCDYFKDETVNEGCFWSERKSYFKKYKCEGEFSTQPAAVAEPSTSTPPTSSKPNQNTTDPWQILIQKYQASGIKLERSSQIFNDPSGPSFYTLMKTFMPILNDALPELNKRNTTIKHISVGSYTSYSYVSQTLYLGANLSRNNLSSYLLYHDQRIELAQNSGVIIEIGIEGHSFGDPTDDLTAAHEKVLFFKSKMSDLKIIAPVINTISLGTHSSVQFYKNTWDLSKDEYQTEFVTQVPILKPLGTLARAGIKIDDYPSLSSNQSEASRLSKWISMNSNALIELKNLYGGLTIEASIDQTTHSARFIPILKKLRIDVGPSAFDVAGDRKSVV